MDSVVNYLKNGYHSTVAFTKFYQMQFKRYRANMFLKLMGFPIRFLVMFVLWGIVLSSNSLGNNQYFVWYYAGVFLILLMYPYARLANSTISQDINNGDILKYTTKGIPYWSVRLADWFVVVKYYIPIMFGGYIALIFIFYETLPFINILAFIYLLIIGSLIQLVVWTMIGIGAFWLEKTYGLSRLYGFMQELLAGALIPIQLLPGLVQSIIAYLPFQFFIFIPIQILLNQSLEKSILAYCVESTVWLIVTLLIAYFLWNKGLKHFKSPL